MPRKNENLLASGLPSKVFLLCYLNPESGYTLAQKIYPDKRYLATAKIYGAAKKLKDQSYLQRNKPRKPFAIRVDFLVKEIVNQLEKSMGMKLFTRDSRPDLIKAILDSEDFKRYVASTLSRKHGVTEPVAELRLLRNSNEEVNALYLISEAIGMLSTFVYMAIRYEKKPPKQFRIFHIFDEASPERGIIERQYDQLPAEVRNRYDVEEWLEGTRQYHSLVRLLQKFPLDYLQDLSRLWSSSDAVFREFLYEFWLTHEEKVPRKK